jgi:hypothetical protein
MKKLVLGCILLCFCATVSIAQPDRQGPRRSPEERAEMTVKNLTKELNLTADQSSKIKVIQLETIKKMDGVREKMKDGNDKKALREEGKAINEAGDKKIKALLSADQIKKYDDWKAKREEEMRKRMEDRRGR